MAFQPLRAGDSPSDSQRSALQAEWKKAQEKARQALQGTKYQEALRFQTADELYEAIKRMPEIQNTMTNYWIEQLQPYLAIMQNVFLMLARPSPPLCLEKKLFFGLLYLIISNMIRSTEALGKFVGALKKVTWQLKLLNRFAHRLGNDPDVQGIIVSALIELINLWVQAKAIFTSQKSPLVHWRIIESAFDSVEASISIHVKSISEIVQVEAAFGRDSRTDMDPVKMLLQGDQDEGLFPINTVDTVVPQFFYRDAEVRKIEDFMSPIPEPGKPLQKVVLCGMGGSGKTTTASAYAQKVQEKREYDAVLWIGSQTSAQIDQSFMNLAVKFNLPLEEVSNDLTALKLRIRTWLEKTVKRWLMIFDNVDDAKLVQENLPSSNGCVLITTRYKDIAREIQAQRLFELTPLSSQQSFEMFQGFRQIWGSGVFESDNANDLHATTEFLIELDGLPLAIEQMAAYATFTEKSAGDLHHEFDQSFKRLAPGLKTKTGKGPHTRSDPYNTSLATVWNLQFAEIRNTVAGHILGLLSLLGADSIPKNLFTPEHYWDEGISNIVVSGIEDRIHFEHSIDLTNARGVEDETARALRMKAIIQNELGIKFDAEEDAGQKSQEILKKFQALENWNLTKCYAVEEERFDMLIPGHRR
ncbi:P-loop containing nucleoside triphosphate hydrolase protein [Astrocystis sublimbata]|nr:P-loop containing nucleoside triphosphate hydrolase protein [Astrocystis sublimbata]